MLANISPPGALSDRKPLLIWRRLWIARIDGADRCLDPRESKDPECTCEPTEPSWQPYASGQSRDSCFECRRNIVVAGEAGPVPLNLRSEYMCGLTLDPSGVDHAIIFLRTPEVGVSVASTGLFWRRDDCALCSLKQTVSFDHLERRFLPKTWRAQCLLVVSKSLY